MSECGTERNEVVAIDLYSGRGGVGYALNALGIQHVGVDIEDYADDYPGDFVQGDASDVSWLLDALESFLTEYETVILWMSPPCQRWSPLTKINATRYEWDEGEIEERYPGFKELNVREVIEAIDPDHYIVENVPRCPKLEDPTRVNGLAFGLPFDLERHFETSYPVPDAVEKGRPDLTMSTRDNYNNTTYQRQELAEAKGVPTDWPEQSVHSAIPHEYVQFLLAHCPAVDVHLPESLRQRPLSDEFVAQTDGGNHCDVQPDTDRALAKTTVLVWLVVVVLFVGMMSALAILPGGIA